MTPDDSAHSLADASAAADSTDTLAHQSEPGSPSLSGTSTPNSNSTARPKRKKATRACNHCQKAHLTCDDARPCGRCVKRKLADTCMDGVRKKAKYLHDTPNELLHPGLYSGGQTIDPTQPILTLPLNVVQSGAAGLIHSAAASPALGPLGAANSASAASSNGQLPLNFTSEAVNLEYAILSNMLPQHQHQGGHLMDAALASQLVMSPHHTPTLGATLGAADHQAAAMHAAQAAAANTAAMQAAWQSHAMQLLGSSPTLGPVRRLTSPQAVYASVTQAYNYTEGYHNLIEYIKNTCEDLVFMEKCFQRTLLEYEKLISFSGTPTVVWRRTGEIALVGKEFSLLTQWTKDQIFSKKTYIWELFDNESAVTYWELFAAIAFDNSQSSVMTTTVVVSPSGALIPCTMCFTIKKDIFDIPLAIIGNFLPILS
ncbi:hypothetical protein BCR44DRAFT_1502496 [Catenaria anguillulae PL171]|uniref:Zn(2)-C6 fungal-type domain-containing protein n=1 Tax=Catenaria anguillulae PL171 TaxID=765915 RepID=A0A1Y2HD59_9FUNG|nr:hypothetical protein BCR44DRAFT_1502496 [Catenaria anguillulae PL171]